MLREDDIVEFLFASGVDPRETIARTLCTDAMSQRSSSADEGERLPHKNLPVPLDDAQRLLQGNLSTD